MSETNRHYFGGAWTASSSPDSLPVEDPSSGTEIGRIPKGSAADAAAAVLAARTAAAGWAREPAGARAERLKAAARALREVAGELADVQMRENGKPLADSHGGVMAGIGAIDQYAELGPLHRGRSLQGGWMATDLMVHFPMGVAAVIVPWNDPVAIACQGLAANLAVGNTVVFKPSEKTALSAVRLVSAMAEHFPPGVLNLLLGDGEAGAAVVESPDVDVVLHTGSVRTGRAIATVCAEQLKKAVVELGGKDPMIVDAGVDPAWAAEQAAIGSFANAGQICTAVERIYAHREIAAAFVDELVKRAERLQVGPGTESDSEIGPLIDAEQRAVVDRHVQDAVDRGAEVRAGGHALDRPGYFYAPTVLTGVTDEMQIMREETFGPVAPVRTVDCFDDALEAANLTEYGLAAVVLTPSQANAQQAWRELRAGTVKINAAFGGAPGGAGHPHKASGLGFGYGPELLDELTLTRVVHYSAVEQ